MEKEHPNFMYVISHVFSRRNAGDGLLVDLTLDACADAGISSDECYLLALDADSFPDSGRVYEAHGEPTARLTGRLVHAMGIVAANSLLAATGSDIRCGKVSEILTNAKAIIGVGGGYLVTDSISRSVGVLLNHITQLELASRATVTTIYMPQSIGPLPGVIGTRVANLLRKIDRVYLRDDESIAELGANSNIRRCADLAVLHLARTIGNPDFSVQRGENTVLVGRGLPRGRSYPDNLLVLAKLLTPHSWAIQADVAGPRSDRAFYEQIGVDTNQSLAESLVQTGGGVVVSVRLHGAIAALLAGWPAIHLSYERKGRGAYEDLGLGEFVHDARNFDPHLVNQQVQLLQNDCGFFWDRIKAASVGLKSQYSSLVSDLRSRLA